MNLQKTPNKIANVSNNTGKEKPRFAEKTLQRLE